MNTVTPLPRLDVLLYAHDGRGLGHASRTIAIGLALRRLYPSARVLFLSGCKMSQELMGPAPLDWLKLPSYETTVIKGKSRGRRGNSNFEDSELAKLRGQQIREIIGIYKPRVVVVDHSPLGKHKELLPALEATGKETSWLLGIRAVAGKVNQVRSAQAVSFFKKHFTALLWYGDSSVVGCKAKQEIESLYDFSAIECGYVSRIGELDSPDILKPPLCATISIPWLGEETASFLQTLYEVLQEIGDEHGSWKIYLDISEFVSKRFHHLFNSLPHCQAIKPDYSYVESLMRSKCAIIFGGYNSLMDVLSLSLPSLVIQRDMQDKEQQYHIDKLLHSAQGQITSLPENCSRQQLHQAVRNLVSPKNISSVAINLGGAEKAAHQIISQTL